MSFERKPGIVVLDTNSLIYSIKNRVDIENQLLAFPGINKIVVPMCVVAELTGLSNENNFARGALRLSARFEVIDSEGSGDECILETAKRHNAIVLTNDRNLISRLKKEKIRVISIRGSRRLDFV